MEQTNYTNRRNKTIQYKTNENENKNRKKNKTKAIQKTKKEIK